MLLNGLRGGAMTVEHGDVSIDIKGNIIIARLKGAFNEYGARLYTENVKGLIDGINGQPFSILVNNLELIGGTPEAYQELEKYNQWLNQQNMIAKAMVITSQSKLDLIDTLSPARKLQRIQNFHTEQEALAWLESLKD